MEIKITADDKLISAINNLADALKLNPFIGNIPGQKSEPVKTTPAPVMAQPTDTAMVPKVAKTVTASQAIPATAPVATPSAPIMAAVMSEADIRKIIMDFTKNSANNRALIQGVFTQLGVSSLPEINASDYPKLLAVMGVA